ncbi:MAG TPA: PilZ domain-containing protein [Nitrospirota bacterium]|nr:PilZ domain-containing protein [Nitrospirota bacterium]
MCPLSREQREFSRVPFATNVEIRAGGRVYSSSQSINISMRGVCIAASGDVPEEGSTCSVTIHLNAGEAQEVIEVRAWVVRSEAGSIAAEFTEIDLESYYRLQRLIVQNADDPVKAEKEFCAHWGILRPRK